MTDSEGTLHGRRLLITGAGGGLGPVAAQLAAAAGARLALCDRSPEGLERATTSIPAGAVEHASTTDLLDPAAVGRAVDELVAAMGGLDGVWHLVGGYRGGVALEEEPPEDLDLLLDLSVRTTMNVARASAPALMASGHGRFLTVSAPIATRPSGQSAAYSIAKAGSDAAVLALADRFRGTGATANIVVVNAIGTANERQTPPERLAQTLVFLTGDAAATMSGQRVSLVGSA